MKKILTAFAFMTKIPYGIYQVIALVTPIIGTVMVCASVPINSVALGTGGFVIGLGVCTAAFLMMLKTWPKPEPMGQTYERDKVRGVEVWYKKVDRDGKIEWELITQPPTWQAQPTTVVV